MNRSLFGMMGLFSLLHLSGCGDTKNAYVKQEFNVAQYQATPLLQEYAQHPKVEKYTLENGLTVLICPLKNSSTVSTQMWYKVGSKDEGVGQRGMAHFLEHMIFKGTKKLSEIDIASVAAKLSGYINAYTWYDYTWYIFDMPVANWPLALPILADSMQNTAFNPEHINSEVKAVIQELKMRKDMHVLDLSVNDMAPAMFPVHGYHHPVVGYKQDLLHMTHEGLLSFYKQFYVPNNATLVIVGDVQPEQVMHDVVTHFAAIPAGKEIVRPVQIDDERIVSHSVQTYKDVLQPIGVIMYKLPGFATGQSFTIDALCTLLGEGKSSLLYKKLVTDAGLVSDVKVIVYGLDDTSLLHITYYPIDVADNAQVLSLIQEEFDAIASGKLLLEQVQRAQKLTGVAFQKKLEKPDQLAEEIGKAYTVLGDSQFVFTRGQGLCMSAQELQTQLQKLVKRYCKASQRCDGQVLPLAEHDKELYLQLQKESDEQDAKIMNAKVRTAPVDQERYAKNVSPNPRKAKQYMQPVAYKLANGLEVYMVPTDTVDLVSCRLVCKERGLLQPENKLGVADITAKILLEGTKKYPKEKFMQHAESLGITFESAAGCITANWLSQESAVALELLTDMLCNPELRVDALAKIKKQKSADLDSFWDTQSSYISYLLDKQIYKNHPRGMIETDTTIQSITHADVTKWYAEKISPQGACLILVGNFDIPAMKQKIEQTLSLWQGPVVPDFVNSPLEQFTHYKEEKYYANRDQTYIAFGGLSVELLDKDYLPLLLFYQIFSVDMNSSLFMLRQRTGLCYSIFGRLTYRSYDIKGKVMVEALVSNDKIEDLKKMMLHEIDHAIDSLTDAQLQEAKDKTITYFDSLYDTNEKIAATLEDIYRLHLPFDFYNQEIERLQGITKNDVVIAVKKYLASDKMLYVQAGRTGDLPLPIQ